MSSPRPSLPDRVRTVRDTFASLDPAAVERVVALLADPARPLVLTGGRFTTAVAGHLGRYLATLRAGVRVLEPEAGARALALLDVDEHTVVVVIDVRPHQHDTVRFGLDTGRRGATVVLLTDRSLSPLAPDADVVLVGDAARTRLAAFEAHPFE